MLTNFSGIAQRFAVRPDRAMEKRNIAHMTANGSHANRRLFKNTSAGRDRRTTKVCDEASLDCLPREVSGE